MDEDDLKYLVALIALNVVLNTIMMLLDSQLRMVMDWIF